MLPVKHRLSIILFCLLSNAVGPAATFRAPDGELDSVAVQKPLRVITINVWSGLDYHGFWNFGEYEPADRRELRFQLLVRQLKNLDPDVVYIQEANPVCEFSRRLADSLSFDETHQVCNAGIKPVVVGPPFNFEEGIAILAQKELRLKHYAVWKLSGSFGLYGDVISLHFDESEFALVAQITSNGQPTFLVNVHLSAFPPEDSVVMQKVREWRATDSISVEDEANIPEILSNGSRRRMSEVENILKNIAKLPQSIPVVLGGDFNSEIDSREMSELVQSKVFRNAGGSYFGEGQFTWDAARNENVAYSIMALDADGEPGDLAGRLSAAYDSKRRVIDYVFLSRHFAGVEVQRTAIVLDSSSGGVHASDHFGILAEIPLPARPANADDGGAAGETRSKIEPLPIFSYDTDIGFGYGAKLFLFDLLNLKESFDFVVFNSTKGERWYRGVFSYPDLEWREGRQYPFAVDLTFDYDKWLKNNFYGVGNTSMFSDREEYTRVPVELSAALSRGFTPQFVGQLVMKYKSIKNYGFDSTSRLKDLPPSLNASTAKYSSVGLNLRYDTRDDYVNPSRGIVLQGEMEYAARNFPGNVSFVRLAGWFQYYRELFYPVTVFALRVGAQQIAGDNLPVQVLTSIGGNNTLRGYTQDRFLDNAGALMNAELRFPIFWRIGGIVGLDAGKVWSSIARADLNRWATNPVTGLRLYMDNFVVRADFGFGSEGMGFYFNFGQMF